MTRIEELHPSRYDSIGLAFEGVLADVKFGFGGRDVWRFHVNVNAGRYYLQVSFRDESAAPQRGRKWWG